MKGKSAVAYRLSVRIVGLCVLSASAARADTLNISFGQPNYSNMVRDAKLRGDGGLQDWNLGTGSGGSNRFYANFLTNGNPSGRLNTFLQWFDVSSIPTGSIINSATLTTYFSNQTADNETWVDVKLSRLQSGNTWTEFNIGGTGPHTDGSVTWNNRITDPTTPTPWATPGALGGADIDLGTTQTFNVVGVNGSATTVVRDITAWVQGWVTTPASNTGMLWWNGKNDVSNSQNRYFWFGTKEDGAGPAGEGTSAAPSLVIDYTLSGGNAPPIITEVSPDPDDNTFVGVPYTKHLTLVQGSPLPTWSVNAGSPPGTTVDSVGNVSGWTPTTGNIGSTLNISIRATNASGFDDEIWGARVHAVPPIIATVTPNLETVSVGTPYVKQLTLTQGTAPITWSVVQGPAGTTVDSTGKVTGWTPGPADVGTTKTFEIKAANNDPPSAGYGSFGGSDTEIWQVHVLNANNGFITDHVFVVRSPNNGGQVREFDKHSATTAIIDDFLPDGTNWQSITFSGRGTGNDARMFLARPNAPGTDIEIAEFDHNANTVHSANLSTIIGGTVGSAVSLGNIRYNRVSDTLFIALNPNYNATTTAIAYEIDLGLTTRLHTWLGETLPADVGPTAGSLYQGVRAAVGINSRDGTLYMTGWHMGQATANGLGDVIAFNTAGRTAGGTTSLFSVLIHGTSYNAGNPSYLSPGSTIFRRRAGDDDTLEIPTNNGSSTATPVLEFYLNTTLHPVDGDGNLILRGSQISIRHGWNGQQDTETKDIWLGGVLFGGEGNGGQFHVIRGSQSPDDSEDTTHSYENNGRQWLDAAVAPHQPCNEPFADADGDHDVDGDDFAIFQNCYTGSGGTLTPDCACFNQEGNDADIDTSDFNAFMNCMSGPAVPANPACGG